MTTETEHKTHPHMTRTHVERESRQHKTQTHATNKTEEAGMSFPLFAYLAAQFLANFDATFCFVTFMLGVLSFISWGSTRVF